MRTLVTLVLGAVLLGSLACVRRLPLDSAPSPCAVGYCCMQSTNRCLASPPHVSIAGGNCQTDGSAGSDGLDGNADIADAADSPGADSGGVESDRGNSDAIGAAPDADASAPDADGGDADASDVEACPSVARSYSWRPMSTEGAPIIFGTAVWTGREMIVWGSAAAPDAGPVAQGARYDPATDRWTAMNVGDLPLLYGGHTAVWLENTQEMFVFGGFDDPALGGLYNPATDTWRPLPSAGGPAGRVEPVVVATGLGAIVWCGRRDVEAKPGDGAFYDPVANRWRAITAVGAPPCAMSPSYAWTGHELAVFGGNGAAAVGIDIVGDVPTTTGGLYDPIADRWRPLAGTPPPGRWGTGATFGDGAFIFTGGAASAHDDIIIDGARYDVATSSWRVLPATAGTGALFGYTAGAWVAGGTLGCTGAAAFWGATQVLPNKGGFAPTANGFLYFPDDDRWEPMQSLGAPTARQVPTVLSTGSTIIVWGGFDAVGYVNTGAIYTP